MAARRRRITSRGLDDDEAGDGLTVDINDSPLYDAMAQGRRPILVPDVSNDDRFPGSTLRPYQSWLGVPLISKEQVLGSLILEKEGAGYYDPQHIEIALSFANQAAVALDNARLFEESWQHSIELNERTQRLARLNRVSGDLGASLDVGHILDVGLREIAAAVEKSARRRC